MMKLSQKDYWLTDKPIAHRGLHSGNDIVPENSLAAFRAAMAHGFPIELDVQLSADGEIFVFHDEHLGRMCAVDKRIKEAYAEELKTYRLLGSSEIIPTFGQVLNLVDGSVPLLIEIKNFGKVGLLESSLYNALKQYRGAYAVQSFNPISLRWFYKNASSVLRGQLSGNFKGEKINPVLAFLLRNLYLNILSRPDFIAYDQQALPSKLITRFRLKGYPILAWTIRSENEYQKIESFSDNIIFENLSTLQHAKNHQLAYHPDK